MIHKYIEKHKRINYHIHKLINEYIEIKYIYIYIYIYIYTCTNINVVSICMLYTSMDNKENTAIFVFTQEVTVFCAKKSLNNSKKLTPKEHVFGHDL